MTLSTTGVPATAPRSTRTLLDRVRAPVRSGGAVRLRRDRDLPAVTRLLGVVYCADHYPDRVPRGSLRGWLTDDVVDAWVAERYGRILGHVATVPVGADPLAAARWREVTGLPPSALRGVSRFFVRRSDRGRGLGSQLLTVAAADVRSRGLVPVLETVTEERTGVPVLHDAGWRLLAVDGRDRAGTRWWVHRYLGPRG